MKKLIGTAALFASIVALSSAQHVVAGSYTMAGTTTGSGPWNMTSTDSTFGVLRFVFDGSEIWSFSQLTDLTYNYDSNLGGIAGGAPRAVVVFTDSTSIIIHWGPAGSFVDPTIGNGLSTGNLLTLTDLGRYDLGGAGGGAYTDRAAALALVGTRQVNRISLVLDSFGGHDRDFDINDIHVETVPEPATLSVLALGSVAFLRRRRR